MTWCSNMSQIKGAAPFFPFCTNNVDLKHMKGFFCQQKSRIVCCIRHANKKSFLYSCHCFATQLLIFHWKLVQIWRKVTRGFFNRRSHCIARHSYEGRGGRLHPCFRHFLRTSHIFSRLTFYDHIII